MPINEAFFKDTPVRIDFSRRAPSKVVASSRAPVRSDCRRSALTKEENIRLLLAKKPVGMARPGIITYEAETTQLQQALPMKMWALSHSATVQICIPTALAYIWALAHFLENLSLELLTEHVVPTISSATSKLHPCRAQGNKSQAFFLLAICNIKTITRINRSI